MTEFESNLLYEGLRAGGAPVMWERIVGEMSDEMRKLVPPNSSVLEIGYGDGVLSCYLAKAFGWRITGMDINEKGYRIATKNLDKYMVRDRVSLLLSSPQEILASRGMYDAVFIKTVLYVSGSIHEYEQWLEFVKGVLRPGGVFVNFESGLSNAGVRLYRVLRRREYRNLCLYSKDVERLYDERFKIIRRKYYGGWSQFASPLPRLYRLAYRAEEWFAKRNADNCFAVGVIAQKS